MNLMYLYYFQSLAETLHYAKSAELLHTSPSNLNYAISSLEQELGFQLFKKCGRNIRLTPNGEIYLKYSLRAIEELEKGKIAAQSLHNKPISTLINAAAFRLHAANDLIKEYSDKTSSNIEVHMHHHKTGIIIEKLKEGSLDIGFCTYAIDDPDLCFYPVSVQNLVAILPKNHPLSGSEKLTLTDLSHYPIIIPHGSDGMFNRISSMFRKLGLSINLACQADSINAAANFSSLGKGISISIHFPILSYFDLEIVPIVDTPEIFYIYFAHNQQHRNSAVLSDLISYFKNYSYHKFINPFEV